jgi:hypothetical protein
LASEEGLGSMDLPYKFRTVDLKLVTEREAEEYAIDIVLTNCSLVGGCQAWKMKAVYAAEPPYPTYKYETTEFHSPEDQNMKQKTPLC